MATYKQRTPVIRYTHIEDENDADPIHIQYHHHLHHNHVSAAATPGHGKHSTAYHGRSSSPSNCNDSFSTTTSFFDTSIPTSNQEWASVGNSSSSSRRKSRERLQQQYHEEQQQLRAQEWHFVLNEQPSRRRQLQQQQQQRRQQEKQRTTPPSIDLNGGATVSAITVESSSGDDIPLSDEEEGEEEEEREAEETTAPPSALTVPVMFLSDDTTSSLDFVLSDSTSIEDPTEDARSLWSHDDEMDSYSASYYSPSPNYSVAGFAPFDFPSSPFMTATTTTTTMTAPSISYNNTPPPASAHPHTRRRLPPSTSGTSLVRPTATPYSSSNSLDQLLFRPTIPQPQQPQQLQGSSSSSTPLFGREWSRFQTHHQSQMPLHDGSGNFALSPPFLPSPRLMSHTTTGTVPGSESGSDLDLELDPLHHFPHHHVYQQQYQHQQHHIGGPKPPVHQYQDDSSSGPKSEVSKKMTMMTMKERQQRQLRPNNSHNSSRSASLSPLTAGTRSRRSERTKSRLREDITMYDDSEVEDMQTMEEMDALVVDIPETTGWLQVFEHALSTFRTSFEAELDSSDSENIHPIKAWARRDEDCTKSIDHQIAGSGRTAPRGSSFADHQHSLIALPSSQSQSSLLSPIEREKITVVRRQMSASSFDTLKRLQAQQTQRHHYNHHYHHSPQRQGAYEDEEQCSSTATLLAEALSALRRFRDHVKSNLMDPALDAELVSDLSRLGFAGDLGMVVAEGNSSGGEEVHLL